MDKNNQMTRRQVIAGLGTTLAASAITPAFGVAAPSQQTDGSVKLSDPGLLYPQPPFKSQPQPWPGLQSKMDPVPDCGEKSYKGSGRLMGRKALITGGDSGMGRAAAIAYAREGADVAINYYPSEEPDAREVIALIRKAGRKAVAIPGDLREEAFCKQLVQRAISELGGLDIIVNNAGPAAIDQFNHGCDHRRIRCNYENEYLRAILDHQRSVTTSAARFGDHWYHIRTGL